MFMNRKGQALLELAILGSLVIVAFSILIGYSERYNREQSYMQQTFRATLQAAYDANNSASYATVDFRRMPNVTSPMEIGALSVFSSSNQLVWSDGKKKDGEETEPKSYFELNRQTVTEIEPKDPVWNITEVTNFGYVSNLGAGAGFHKTENNNITTNKDLGATDYISGSSDVSGTSVSLGSSLGAGGVYTGGGLGRSTSMQ